MVSVTARPGKEQIWEWLSEVPDPEIPVISVVDLGIVRELDWQGDTLVVKVTPTYSGCPATRVINDDIVAHLRERGIEQVRTERQLSPAWTTAWLSKAGREKLRAYGIAPPVDDDGGGCAIARAAAGGGAVVKVVRPGERERLTARAGAGISAETQAGAQPGSGTGSPSALSGPPGAPSVTCPRCGAQEAERVSQFGSTPCKASYRCRECLEPFDYFKSI